MSFLHDRRTFADLIGRAPAPEYLQRSAQTRRTNIAMAQRRLLDRETYRGLRKYIRCPIDRLELERNTRWTLLRARLFDQVHAMRSHPGRALFHVIARDGVPAEYVGETARDSAELGS